MNDLLFTISMFFQLFSMLAGAIIAIILLKRIRNDKNLKEFYFYSFMAAAFLSMVVIDHYFPIYGRAGLMFVDSVALLIHYTFLGAFIYRIVNSQKRSLLLLGLLVVLFPTILFFSVNHDISKLPSNGVAIANFGLVVFCCFYYFHLFNSKLTKNLLKDPAFWIITGIFCCMGATVPMLAITQYLIENTSRSVLSGLRVYVPFLYGVMHLFFIKAYLCTAKLSKA